MNPICSAILQSMPHVTTGRGLTYWRCMPYSLNCSSFSRTATAFTKRLLLTKKWKARAPCELHKSSLIPASCRCPAGSTLSCELCCFWINSSKTENHHTWSAQYTHREVQSARKQLVCDAAVVFSLLQCGPGTGSPCQSSMKNRSTEAHQDACEAFTSTKLTPDYTIQRADNDHFASCPPWFEPPGFAFISSSACMLQKQPLHCRGWQSLSSMK